MRIVTSAEGIAFYCLLYHLSTTWKNIAGISERINRQGRRYKVLELRQPAETFAANRWLGFINFSLNPRGSYIPIDYFITLGKPDPKEQLFQTRFPEQVWDNIRKFLLNLAAMPLWANTDLADTVFGGFAGFATSLRENRVAGTKNVARARPA